MIYSFLYFKNAVEKKIFFFFFFTTEERQNENVGGWQLFRESFLVPVMSAWYVTVVTPLVCFVAMVFKHKEE